MRRQKIRARIGGSPIMICYEPVNEEDDGLTEEVYHL